MHMHMEPVVLGVVDTLLAILPIFLFLGIAITFIVLGVGMFTSMGSGNTDQAKRATLTLVALTGMGYITAKGAPDIGSQLSSQELKYLIIESTDIHRIQADRTESYDGTIWHPDGTLLLEDTAALEFNDTA